MKILSKIKTKIFSCLREYIVLPLLLLNFDSKGYFFIVLRNLNEKLRNEVYRVKKY